VRDALIVWPTFTINDSIGITSWQLGIGNWPVSACRLRREGQLATVTAGATLSLSDPPLAERRITAYRNFFKRDGSDVLLIYNIAHHRWAGDAARAAPSCTSVIVCELLAAVALSGVEVRNACLVV
jgi:hypothetical protein